VFFVAFVVNVMDMPTRTFLTALLALEIALAFHAPVVAQRGGGAPRPPIYPTKGQFDASAEAQKHVAAAKALARTDLQTEFENTCSYTGPERAALRRERLGQPPIKDYTLEPTKIFDNVWFMGLASQGAFVITTTQGLILIDTLNSTEEARDILVPSMRKVGLDPAQIKYIVLSHGHPGQSQERAQRGVRGVHQATLELHVAVAQEFQRRLRRQVRAGRRLRRKRWHGGPPPGPPLGGRGLGRRLRR